LRKYQQKQILELLGTLKSLQGAELFADCQDGAIVIGEFVEEIKGEGTQTVALLEDYCELIYRASIGEADDKALAKGLLRVENSVKSELKPTRFEIVFLSYKASMCDSIESIYTAAKDDPSCDVFWIPIPYYECNPDGSLGVMNFEWQEYYKPHIECTDYRDYNIEERHPDVIITFAPYDNLGHMTSIHPDFYCKRLRELTELLVYVPYFVTNEDIGAPFTKCPGVMFSHLVVVQSEAVRQCYIRDYKELEKIGYSRDIYGAPEDKIVALGSPKFDAVINAKRDDFSLPKSWTKFVGNKKVVLFNTSVTAILNHGEQYLMKLQYVLDTFRDRNDAVLWWRPHPLSETTYNAMESGLAGQYKRIVDEYKHYGYGVYDDTPDLHRAISWTDAYYGDWSSLVLLYLFTGKSIMISNPKIQNDLPPFEPTTIFITEDKFWFTIRRFNALISTDRNTWLPEFAGSFPGESDYTEEYNDSLYRNPVEANGVLYYPPFLANEIAIYSPQTEAFEKIQYKDDKGDEKITRDFLGAVKYGDDIYFAPYEYSAIVQLNLNTLQISHHNDWLIPVKKVISNFNGSYFSRPIVVGSSMWFSIVGSNAVMELNMDTKKHIIYEIGEKKYRYARAYFDGSYFWWHPMYGTTTPIIKWSPETGVIKAFHSIYTSADIHGYLPCIACNCYIWLFPLVGENTYKIDMTTDRLSIANEFESNPAKNEAGDIIIKYTFVQSHRSCIYAYYAPAGTLIEYDCTTKERREKVISYTPDIIAILGRLLYSTYLHNHEKLKTIYDCFYYEGAYTWLDSFISFLVSENNDNKTGSQTRRKKIAATLTKNADGTSGKVIHEYIMKLLLS
jgi:hypothetical protein